VLLAALFYLLSSAYLLLLGNAAFTLRPFCVALGRRWCEHTYPRWDAHTMPICTCNTSVLGTSASIMGSELQPLALRSTPPRCPKPSPNRSALCRVATGVGGHKPET
jgi:hypothetical protein